MADEPIRFAGGSGAELAGVLRMPDGEPRGGVVLSHCFTCSKDLHTMTRLSKALTAAGWAVLRFDFTGIGESEGDFSEKTVTRNVEDIVKAAEVVTDRVDGPLGLLGHSLGGAATLLAAHRVDPLASVVVLGAPSTPAHIRSTLSEVADEAEREGVVTATIAGRAFPISAGFLADLERHEQGRLVGDLGCPLMIIHAIDDEVVPIAEGEANFAAARQPKAFIPLFGADHLVSDRNCSEQVAALVVDWLDHTT